MTIPRINGNLYSYASVKLKVGRKVITAFKSISYSDNRERKDGYGASEAHGPIAQTQGVYKTDPVEVEIEKGQLQELRDELAQEAGSSSFGSVEFEIVVQYEDTGRPLITDTLLRCTWSANASKIDDGGDPAYDATKFKTMFIKWNGKTLYEERGA
jgi:hypothetical protein